MVLTSGRSSLTKGRITPPPPHESFNRLHSKNVSFKRFQHKIIRAFLLPAHAIFTARRYASAVYAVVVVAQLTITMVPYGTDIPSKVPLPVGILTPF